jgi:Putative zinc-finger/FecR protein
MSANETMCYRGCCTEWEHEILLYMDHELAPNSCERVQRHMEKCEDCARFYRIIQREEQLLCGRLRNQVEMTTDPGVIADLVMSDIPAFQPVTWQQRLADHAATVFNYLSDKNRRHYSLVASILVCLFGILFTMQVGNVTEEGVINIVRSGIRTHVAPGEYIVVSTDEGEFIELPDQSVVYATPGTYFTIESYLDHKVVSDSGGETINEERHLKLISGALCIDVRSHPVKTGFSVTCSNADAKVFGTQFYVHTTTGPDKVTQVGVRTGQVMVEKRGKNQVGYTVLGKREMTTVTNFNGNVHLLAPRNLKHNISKLLECFNEQLDDRAARRMLPVLKIIGEDKVILSDSMQPLQPLA